MKISLLLLSICGLSLSSVQAQTIIYRETFGNNTNADQPLSAINTSWTALSSETGATSLLTSSVISRGEGSPTNVPNVGTGQTSLSQSQGFFFAAGGYANGLLHTTLPGSPAEGVLGPISIADFSSISFQWYQANSTNSGSSEQKYTRLAIQVDGNWYVSTQKLFVENATFNGTTSAREEFSYNFSTNRLNWLQLSNATVGSNPMTIGTSPASDLSGSLSGFGIWNPGRTGGGPNGSLFVDSFTVTATAVPEPAIGVLALLGLGTLSLLRRRKPLTV